MRENSEANLIIWYSVAGLPREPGEAVRHPLPHVQPEAEAVARRQDGAGVHLRPGMFITVF